MSFTAALLLAVVLQQSPSGEIRGTVLADHEGARSPLPFAMVEVVGGGSARTVVANGSGRYVLTEVPAGQPLRLRALHIGHEETRVDVSVPQGTVLMVDLVLAEKPVELPRVLVKATAISIPEVTDRRPTPEQERARAEIAVRTLDASPGLVEAGVGEVARRPGSGNDPSDPSDVLFMRGSTADMKLVLLDGAPVYTPFHLGGLLRSFDEKVLGTASHHVGGAPARYDGGLSYILDLRTRSPARDRLHTTGAVDLMSASATLEGPIGSRAGLLFSSRALHGLQSRLAGGGASPYGYVDAMARGEIDLAENHRLSLFAFANEESVRLSMPQGGDATELSAEFLLRRRPDAASWSNAAASMSYAAEWENTTLDVTASTSRYRADLPIPVPGDSTGASADGPPSALIATGSTQRGRLTVDGVRTLAWGAVRFGGALDHSTMKLGARRFSTQSGVGAQEYERDAQGTVAGAYLDVIGRLAPSLTVRSGVRLDRFDPGGTRGALRLALMWGLTEDALLTIAGGRYHQLIRTTDADMELAVGDGLSAGTGGPTPMASQSPLLSVASADHVVLTLDQQLAPNVRLTTEGFYKRFVGLDGLGSQELNSSGLDLRVLRSGSRMTGWLGYSLSWFWNNPDALGRSEEFTGRHMLSAGLNGKVSGRWGLDLALAYSDGLPLTSIPFARGASETSQDGLAAPTVSSGSKTGTTSRTTDTFFRVDLEVFADLEPHLLGRTMTVRPYLRVLNALDRRDALFYYFEPWRDPDLTPLAELSVIPLLGLEWRF